LIAGGGGIDGVVVLAVSVLALPADLIFRSGEIEGFAPV